MYIVKELQCSLINALSILQLFEGRPEEISSERASTELRIMKRRQKEGQQESPLLQHDPNSGCNPRPLFRVSSKPESPQDPTPGGVPSLLSQLPSPLGAISSHSLGWESGRSGSSLGCALAVCLGAMPFPFLGLSFAATTRFRQLSSCGNAARLS